MKGERPVFMGIDLGTQSVRVGLVGLDGQLIVSETASYPTEYPRPGWAEQEPHQWWDALVGAAGECLDGAVDTKRIAAVAVAATSSTILPVRENGEPLDRAILWMDKRASEETRLINETEHPILKYAGGEEAVEWMTPKMLWLKRNRPEVYENADYIVEATDWITHRLTGEWITSRCNAACKSNYVSREGGWDGDFYREIGLEDGLQKMPRTVVPMAHSLGQIDQRTARELGCPPDVEVAVGGIDAHVGMVGMNALSPDDMAVILGSSNVFLTQQEDKTQVPGIWGPYSEPIQPGTWLFEGGQVSTGSIVNWLVDNIAQFSNGQEPLESTLERLDEKARDVPIGCEGLTCLDYWQGNRTPRRDPDAQGVLFGLSLKHDFSFVLRSIYEGIAFGTRHILDTFMENGIRPGRIVACGGGTKSELWSQLTADVTGLPLNLPRDRAYSTLIGCAAIGSVAVGTFDDLSEAADHMVEEEAVIRPGRRRSGFEEPYQRYLRLYEEVKDMF